MELAFVMLHDVCLLKKRYLMLHGMLTECSSFVNFVYRLLDGPYKWEPCTLLLFTIHGCVDVQ